MRARVDIKMLRQIVAIRELQRTGAEAAARRTGLACQEAQEARDEGDRQLALLDEGWRSAVAGSALGTSIAEAWSAALMRQVTVVQAADDRLAATRAENEHCVGQWRIAVMRCDVSQGLADMANRRMTRHREETRLNEAADRHAGKGMRI